MYHLIATHSVFRYLLLIVLLLTIYLAWEGYFFHKRYAKRDRILAGATSGISHIQLLLGFSLYIQSPVAQGFWAHKSFQWTDNLFFGIVHFTLMSIAIVIITIGAALSNAKGKQMIKKRFKIIFQYFTFALVLILVAIPWPFSPLAQRPFIREF